MSNMAIARPLTPSSITASHGTASDENLMTDDPREIWLGTSTGAAVFTIDLGSIQVISCLFAGYFNAPLGTRWSAKAGMAAATETTLFMTQPLIGQHALQLFSPIAARYVEVTMTPPAGFTLQGGILFAGQHVQSTWGHEWGSGRPIYDSGARDRLLGGGFGINRGAASGGYNWSFGDLYDWEVQALYGLLKQVGQNRPAVLAEDPEVRPGTLVSGGNVEIADRTVTKTTGAADDWDAAFSVAESRTGSCYLSWTAPAATRAYQIGFDGGNAGAFALALEADGTMAAVMTASIGSVSVGSYAAGDVLAIAYDGIGKVEFFKNGASIYLSGAAPGLTMAASGMLKTVGARADNIYFGETGLADRLHYGLMTIDKYERLLPQNTRWALAIEDWL